MKAEQKVKIYTALADQYINEKNWTRAIETYMEITKIPEHIGHTNQVKLGQCLAAIGQGDLALEILDSLHDDETINGIKGDIAYRVVKDSQRSLGYFLKQAEWEQTPNASLYNTIGHLFSQVYHDKKGEEQIKWFRKAYDALPFDAVIINNLALTYAKLKKFKESEEFYQKLFRMNPTHDQYHAYGAYQINQGKFKSGFKYLQHRWDKETGREDHIDLPIYRNKTKLYTEEYQGETKDKTLLICWEQGFGDTILFARFIDILLNKFKKVLFVVQKPMVELMKHLSFKDDKLEIYTEADIPDLEYDLWIPTFDLPLVCNIENPDDIPCKDKYLDISLEDIKEYGEQYIPNSNKLKVGIVYQGTKKGEEAARDVKLSYFEPLLQLDNVEVYNFQYDDRDKQKAQFKGRIKDLAYTFKDWYCTACAIANMDIMIATDCGVMNLAGAMGKRTLGLFNSITEFRWYNVPGSNTGWYESVIPYQCINFNEWEHPIDRIIKERIL